MVEPVIVRYPWTLDEFLTAHKWRERARCGPAFTVGVRVVYALGLLVGLLGWVGWLEELRLTPIVGGIVGAYGLCLRPVYRRWWYRRRFEQCSDRNAEVEWRFDAEKVVVRSPTGHGETDWTAICKAAVTPQGLLVFPTPEIFNWLPRQAFESQNQYDRLTDLIRSKVSRVERVR